MLFGQEMKQKLRILVLASSNAAVDIIAKRLLHIRDKMKIGMCDVWNGVIRRQSDWNMSTLYLFIYCIYFQRPRRIWCTLYGLVF